MKEPSYYTLSVRVRTFWTIILPLAIVVCIAGAVIGMLVVDRLIMPQIVSVDKGIVEVPDLIDMPWRDARQKLYNKGLRLNQTAKEYNDTIARGNIISQEPAPGTKMDKSKRRSVKVKVSKGSEIATVPDMRNIKVRIATRKLQEQGFHVEETIKRYANTVDKDNVITTDPEPGVEISREVPVKVYVSKGKKPTKTTVPNLVGEMLSDARRMIKENDLVVGTITTEKTASSKPGMVISQSLSPGNNVPFHSTIDLTVSSGK